MKVFVCKNIEEYGKLVEFASEQDQPVYFYRSDDREDVVLVSTKEVENVESKIDELLEIDKKDLIVDDNEPIWEDTEDMPLDWFF